jgi:hypothetical protein
MLCCCAPANFQQLIPATGSCLVQVWTSFDGSKTKLIIQEGSMPNGTDLAFAHELDPPSIAILTDGRVLLYGENEINLDAIVEAVCRCRVLPNRRSCFEATCTARVPNSTLSTWTQQSTPFQRAASMLSAVMVCTLTYEKLR